MSERLKILIIGGVAAGATAAAKARRVNENAEISILEKSGYVSYANCGLPYYIGGVIKNRGSLLLQNQKGFKDRFNVDVFLNTTAISIDSERKIVSAVDSSGAVSEFQYDKLILANGAKSVVPPIGGIADVEYFPVRTVEDVDKIKTYLEERECSSAAVIGGGYIGIETAEALFHCGLQVSVIEALPNIMNIFPSEVTLKIKSEMEDNGIKIHTNTKIIKVSKLGGKIELEADNGDKFYVDILFMAAGVKPDIELARAAGVDIGVTGGVKVNQKMETSIKDIYAAGDLVEKYNIITGKPFLLPLAGPANKEGRIAGCNAAGGEMYYKGSAGASIISFGDACIAHVGLTLEDAVKNGFDADYVYTEDANHAEYYPGARYIFTKLVYDKKDGTILGASLSGTVGVDRRADVFSTAIYSKLTIYDLEHLDFCYSPPHGSAKDPVNVAGYVAVNNLKGGGFGINPEKFLDIYMSDKEVQYLDTRTKAEYKMFHLKKCKNIYANDLRSSLHLLKREIPIYVHCAVGYRGYIAVKILRNNGFEAYNVLGGLEAVKRLLKIKNISII